MAFSRGASGPDGDFCLGLAYGPNTGQNKDSRFALPEFDRLYERQARLPDGPERLALMRRALRLQMAYAPQIPHSHPLQTDLFQPRVQGPYRQPFSADWFRWVGVGGGGREDYDRLSDAVLLRLGDVRPADLLCTTKPTRSRRARSEAPVARPTPTV